MKPHAVGRMAVGTVVLVGFFAAMYFVLVKVRADNPMRDVVLIFAGTLGAKFGTVVDWYFGSSAGSDVKTELLKGKP
jgi:hypothetical protein